MRFRLLPTDDRFFVLFNDAARNVAEAARHFRDMLDSVAGGYEGVLACEKRGDDLTREILRRLNTSFVTPFDREDIHALAERLDDVVDDVLDVVYQLDLGHRDAAAVPELREQGELLVRIADEAVALVAKLESMKGVHEHLDAIDRLESEADRVYRRALARLYSGEMQAMAVLQWKDVVGAVENAIDKLEDVSNVVEAITLKHA